MEKIILHFEMKKKLLILKTHWFQKERTKQFKKNQQHALMALQRRLKSCQTATNQSVNHYLFGDFNI